MTGATSAIDHGLRGCRACGLVSSAERRCPRCHVPLPARKPDSLQRTAAFSIAALILYVPANVLPVMTTISVGGGARQHTILGGIADLWASGSWALAVIVWVASIAVPTFKIAALALLVATARRGPAWRPLQRTRLYRVVHTVGHWSMLDVFVVVLLTGMLRFGPFASVQPEPGLLAFGAVVILTMLAAASFDPRLIWSRTRHDG